MIHGVLSDSGRWDPIPAGRSSIGRICPGCGEPLKAGQRPVLVNGEPADKEEAALAAAGRAHTVACQLAHEACAVAWTQRRREEHA